MRLDTFYEDFNKFWKILRFVEDDDFEAIRKVNIF